MEENLSELLIKKEKELQEISKLRLLQLEDQLRSKNSIIDELSSKLEKIQEDFNYNVKLIDDRDVELYELEQKFDSIRKMLKQKDAENSELRASLASTEQRQKLETSKIRTQEIILIEARDSLREELAEIKWKKEDEIRKMNKAFEESEAKFEVKLREKDTEIIQLKNILIEKYEKMMNGLSEKYEDEKKILVNEITEKNSKIQSLTRTKNEIQDQFEKLVNENNAEDLEKYYEGEIKKYQETLSEKEIQVNKLIDHSKYLSQQMELIKKQLESESEYSSEQKNFYEKELQKFKNSSHEELEFLKQSYEIQIQRLNNTYNSQINRLQERITSAEAESEKNYIQFQQIREKSLQIHQKSANELEKIEENHQKDIKNYEESLKLLKLESSHKEIELKSLQENLGAWKQKCEAYSDENKKLRLAISELEIEKNSIKSEILQIKENRMFDNDKIIQRLKEEYENKLKELADDLEFAKAKAGLSNAEKFFKKSQDFPKLWSEDYGPASSFHSESRGNNEEIIKENQELKKIVEIMRKDMEVISMKAIGDPSEIDKLKVTVSKLKNELNRVSSERDQLLDISSELKAELRKFSKDPQYQEHDLISQISYMQEGLQNQENFVIKKEKNQSALETFENFQSEPVRNYQKSIPKYDEFENILNLEPEKEEKFREEGLRKGVPPVNSLRETASQKEVHERFKANLKKTKKPLARNYNIKE